MAARRTSRRMSCTPPNGGAWFAIRASTISETRARSARTLSTSRDGSTRRASSVPRDVAAYPASRSRTLSNSSRSRVCASMRLGRRRLRLRGSRRRAAYVAWLDAARRPRVRRPHGLRPCCRSAFLRSVSFSSTFRSRIDFGVTSTSSSSSMYSSAGSSSNCRGGLRTVLSRPWTPACWSASSPGTRSPAGRCRGSARRRLALVDRLHRRRRTGCRAPAGSRGRRPSPCPSRSRPSRRSPRPGRRRLHRLVVVEVVVHDRLAAGRGHQPRPQADQPAGRDGELEVRQLRRRPPSSRTAPAAPAPAPSPRPTCAPGTSITRYSIGSIFCAVRPP